LFALATVLLGFASDAGHKLIGYGGDSYGRENTAERGDELGFDDFNSDVVDETFQGNLYEHMRGLAMEMMEVEAWNRG